MKMRHKKRASAYWHVFRIQWLIGMVCTGKEEACSLILYTKTILYKHFTIPPFLILHSPFMIITVDEVNNKKRIIVQDKRRLRK